VQDYGGAGPESHDGLVDNVEIKKSCGIPLLDKSALATVRNASPLPKPPMAIRISIPILYQLN
jgi:TonB family protein